MEDIKLKPILKWAGGKIRIIGKIKDKVSISDRYVEPFIGGGSVFLTLKPTKAILNDINPYLITMYKTVRDKPEELILKLKEYEKKNTKEEYYEIRSKGIKNDDDVEQSAILIYINKTCFRGLYRENSKGGFNVPYGNYKKPLICDETNIKNISKYLNENDQFFYDENTSKGTFLKQDSELYNEDDDVPGKSVRIKKIGSNWQIFVDNNEYLLLKGTRFTAGEKTFLCTQEGVQFILDGTKRGWKSVSEFKRQLKSKLE